MFQTFLTGLREGLEAALVVGILVAYLVKSDRREMLRAVWTGVGVAVALSVAVVIGLAVTSSTLDDAAEEAFAGVTSLLAVGFVTWMVFWMRSQAQSMRGELQGQLDRAMTLGTGAVALTAFLAVGREGLETALFIWPVMKATGSGDATIIGAVLGIALAVLLGVLVYRRSVKLDLAKFFRITGIALVIIAAGVLAYGVHELQEVGVLPGEDALAWDLRSAFGVTEDSSSWYATLLEGTINFRAKMSVLEVIVYVAYLVPVMSLFLRRPRALQPAV